MNWKDDKNLGPWSFEKQSDRLYYNQGDRISSAKDPTFITDFTGVPVTPIHNPCGYFHSTPKSRLGWHSNRWKDLVISTLSVELGGHLMTGEVSCTCTGISIGYTTQQMAVDEVQTLSVTGAVEGCTYDWAIDSGGGSLSSLTGTSVNYTAPSTNPECANNPTISLSVEGNTCDTLALAINAGSGKAYKTNFSSCMSSPIDCGGECNCGCFCNTYDFYSCDNTFYSHYEQGEEYTYCGCTGICHYDPLFCWSGMACPCGLTVVDIRSDAQKTAGCCPVELL